METTLLIKTYLCKCQLKQQQQFSSIIRNQQLALKLRDSATKWIVLLAGLLLCNNWKISNKMTLLFLLTRIIKVVSHLVRRSKSNNNLKHLFQISHSQKCSSRSRLTTLKVKFLVKGQAPIPFKSKLKLSKVLLTI